jgi:hypothetical protein
MEGQEDQQVILAQGRAKGTFLELKAAGHRVAVAPRAERADPRVDGLGRVCEHAGLAFLSASGWEADSLLGIGPVDTNKSRACCV